MRKLLISFFILILLFGLASCGIKEDAKSRIERFSNISLPDDMTEVYNYRDTTFTGVAGQYTVFKLKEESNLFEEKEEQALTEVEKDNILYYLKDIYKIPEKYYLDFDKEYQYVTGNENTYAFYYPDDLELKVFMGGHWFII